MKTFDSILSHGGAILIDASTLEGRFMMCPREYYYYAACKREPNTFAAGLKFGSFVHDELMAPHYSGQQVDIDKALEKFPAELTLSGNYRNAGYAKTLWNGYINTYPVEPFNVLQLDGKMAVELPFCLPIGTMKFREDNPFGQIPVMWTGKIDLGVQWPNENPSPLDHKTSAIGGESMWDGFVNSTQQLGYCWAMEKLFNAKVDSYCINLLITRKLTATGKGIEYARQRFPVDREKLENFPRHVMSHIDSILQCFDRGYFPQNTCNCTRKYGRCDFIGVCRVPPSLQEETLSTALFKDVTWSPLSEKS